MDLIFWVAFLVFIGIFLALDLGVFHKDAHVVPPREALAWTAVWVTLAINVCQAAVVGLALRWIGMPSPLLWAVATVVLEFVPYLGATVMIALISVTALATFDDAWRVLLEQWLQDLGYEVVTETGEGSAPTTAVDLVIVDLPFPRQGGVDLVKRITSRHPATPIVALSSNFFSRIECCGPVARDLGVDCVLPKPATREALAAAVRRVLPV